MYILYCLIGIFVIVFTVVMAICLHKKTSSKFFASKKSEFAVVAAAPTIIYDRTEFEIQNDVLTKYLGNALEVRIPNGVKEIRSSAFDRNQRIRSVFIPESVKIIGERAFLNCVMLSKIEFSEGIALIEQEAFRDCTSLLCLTLPQSLTTIKNAHFTAVN